MLFCLPRKLFYIMNLRKFSVYISIFSVLIYSFVSCASTPKKEVPLWTEEATIEEAFPSATYVARIGRGETADAARNFADAELTRHFEHSVKSSSAAKKVMSNSSGTTKTDERVLEQEVFVSSSMELFALHHTDYWFDAKTKRYVVCSYIERAEAWQIFESKVQQAQKEFFAKYNLCGKEKSSLSKMQLLSECIPVAEKYLDVLDFAHTLSPEGEKKYLADRETIAGISAQISDLKKHIVLRVSVSGDKDKRVERLVSQIISENGFSISASGSDTVNVNVQQNKVFHGSGDSGTITAEPGVTIVLSSNGKNLFSYNKTLSRVTGFTQAEAFVDNKIYSAIETELKSSFAEEFSAAF